MKSTLVVNANEVKLKKYPYLGIKTMPERVVLFSGPKKGMTVNYETGTFVGEYSESWCEEDFTLFDGQVLLEN